MTALQDGTHLYSVQERKKYGERAGFKITELVLTGDQCVPWHRHTAVLDTFYVMEGVLKIELANPDECISLKPTETFTVVNGRLHRVSSHSGELVRFIVVGDAQGKGAYDYEPVPSP